MAARRPDQPVEERGLAHVGPAHQREQRPRPRRALTARASAGWPRARSSAPPPCTVSARKTLQPSSRSRPCGRLGADLLQQRPALADHDGLLRLALHADERRDADQPAALAPARLVELLHLDRGRVGDLLARAQHQLLPHVLGGELALGLVGEDVGREERRLGHGELGGQRRDEPVDVLAGEGGERHDLLPGVEGAVGLDDRQQGRARGAVHLVHAQHGRLAGPASPRRCPSGWPRPPPRARRGRSRPRRGRAPRPPRSGSGRAVSTMCRLRAPLARWRPGVSKKASWAPGTLCTPRMRLRVVWGRGRDDGHVLAQDPVEQRGLADVGAADDGDEAGAEGAVVLARHGGDRAAPRHVAGEGALVLLLLPPAAGGWQAQGSGPRVMTTRSRAAPWRCRSGRSWPDQLEPLHHLAEDGVAPVQVRGRAPR